MPRRSVNDVDSVVAGGGVRGGPASRDGTGNGGPAECRLGGTHPATQRDGRTQSQGTGFVWLDTRHVVTALHVVAGATRIDVYSEAKKDAASAKVEAANLQADLALLTLTKDLGLPPLTAAPARISDEHYIWGYPLDVATMQRDDIRFSRGLQESATLKSIFQTEDRFRKVVGSQPFPRLDAEILRVSSIITHGQSGAPILNRTGQVVGVGDGGLHEGAARINWAIPAATYLKGRDSFTDPAPTAAALASSLMSAVTERRVDAIPQPQPGQPLPTATGPRGDLKNLHLTWTASLKDLLETLPDSEYEDFEDIVDDLGDDAVARARIDVYEDVTTGATIAVPHGADVSFDANKHLLKALSQDGSAEMIVQITSGERTDDSESASEAFQHLLDARGAWQVDPKNPDDEDGGKDPDGTVWSHVNKSRVLFSREQPKVVTKTLEAEFVREGGDFLGTAVIVTLSPRLNQKLVSVMEACVLLSDFAKH
ncbi:MAG: serine protease [Gemmatimonadaceae bacterium]